MSCVTPMCPLVVEKSSHLMPHHLCLRRQRQGFELKCAHTDLSGFSATDTVPVVLGFARSSCPLEFGFSLLEKRLHSLVLVGGVLHQCLHAGGDFQMCRQPDCA